MKIADKLKEYMDGKVKCFVNGMPEEEGGIITKIEEDFLVFEVTDIDEKNQSNSTKEEICIPLKDITMLSVVKKLSVL